jgi:hypothetical protein
VAATSARWRRRDAGSFRCPLSCRKRSTGCAVEDFREVPIPDLAISDLQLAPEFVEETPIRAVQLTLADVMGSAHKAAAEGMAASLPPAPRCPL